MDTITSANNWPKFTAQCRDFALRTYQYLMSQGAKDAASWFVLLADFWADADFPQVKQLTDWDGLVREYKTVAVIMYHASPILGALFGSRDHAFGMMFERIPEYIRIYMGPHLWLQTTPPPAGFTPEPAVPELMVPVLENGDPGDEATVVLPIWEAAAQAAITAQATRTMATAVKCGCWDCRRRRAADEEWLKKMQGPGRDR